MCENFEFQILVPLNKVVLKYTTPIHLHISYAQQQMLQLPDSALIKSLQQKPHGPQSLEYLLSVLNVFLCVV